MHDFENWFVLTYPTIKRLQKVGKYYSDSLGLYVFYYTRAKEQGTDKVYATSGYCAKGLNWNIKKVRKIKQILLDLNLIEEIHAHGRTAKAYIKINCVPIYEVFNYKSKIKRQKENNIKTHTIKKSLGDENLPPKKEDTNTEVYGGQDLWGAKSKGGKKSAYKCFINENTKCFINEKENNFSTKNSEAQKNGSVQDSNLNTIIEPQSGSMAPEVPILSDSRNVAKGSNLEQEPRNGKEVKSCSKVILHDEHIKTQTSCKPKESCPRVKSKKIKKVKLKKKSCKKPSVDAQTQKNTNDNPFDAQDNFDDINIDTFFTKPKVYDVPKDFNPTIIKSPVEPIKSLPKLSKIKIKPNPLVAFNFSPDVFAILNHWRILGGKVPKKLNTKIVVTITKYIEELLMDGNNPYYKVLDDSDIDQFRMKKWTVKEIQDTITYYVKDLHKEIDTLSFDQFIVHKNYSRKSTFKDFSILVTHFKLLPQKQSFITRKLKEIFTSNPKYSNIQFYDKSFITIGNFIEEKLKDYKSGNQGYNSFNSRFVADLFHGYMYDKVKGKYEDLKYMANPQNLKEFFSWGLKNDYIRPIPQKEKVEFFKKQKEYRINELNAYQKSLDNGKKFNEESLEWLECLKSEENIVC